MMKRTICLFLIGISGMTFAQSDSTLFGLTRNTVTQDVFLSKLEPSTGEMTVLSTEPLSSMYTLNRLATIDPFQARYYFGMANTLFTVDLATGNLLSEVEVSLPGNGYFDFMQFNTHDSTLYGLSRTGGFPSNFSLVTMDPSTGIATQIGASSHSDILSVGAMSLIDPMNHLFYVQSATSIIGFSTLSGEVEVNTPLNLPANHYLDFMRINYADSLIYGILRSGQPFTNFLCQIDPATGNVTALSDEPFSEGFSLANGLASIDPVNRIFYVQATNTFPVGGLFLFGLDIETGEAVVYQAMDQYMDDPFEMVCYFPDFGPPQAFIVSTEQAAKRDGISVYPNPTHSELTISAKSDMGTGTFVIIDIQGVKLYQGEIRASKTRIDVSHLDAGIYLLVVNQGSYITTEKILIY